MTKNTHAPENKVGRLLRQYHMEEFGDWLETAWTAEGDDRLSLRDLQDEFNKRILKNQLVEAGQPPSNVGVEYTYEVLTNAEPNSSERIRKRRELERVGIDVDDITDEFVTHQTIYNYLTDIRGADFDEASYEDQLQRNVETLQRLQSRMKIITKNTIDRMCDADRDVDEKYKTLADVQVICRFCGNGYSAVELVEQGGCPCDQ